MYKKDIISFFIAILMIISIFPYINIFNQKIFYFIEMYIILLLFLILSKKTKFDELIYGNYIAYFYILFFLIINLVRSFIGYSNIYITLQIIGYTINIIFFFLILPKFLDIVIIQKYLIKISINISLLFLIIIVLNFQNIIVNSLNLNQLFNAIKYILFTKIDPYFDLNYFAGVDLLGFISLLNYHNINKYIKNIFLMIILFSILLTASRASLLSLAVVIYMYILFQKDHKIIKYIYILIIFSFFLLFVNNYDLRIFFKYQKGLDGRDLLWPVAIKGILENPILGIQYDSIKNYIINTLGKNWYSSHNTILDLGLSSGLLMVILWILLIIQSFKRIIYILKCGYREMFILLQMLVGIVIIGMFTSFQIGGIGLISLIFTIVLGLIDGHYLKLKYNS